jgi:hypothetical protein
VVAVLDDERFALDRCSASSHAASSTRRKWRAECERHGIADLAL